MDGLTIITIVLCVGYISYIIFERFYYCKLRKSFKHVILVNGIRGKSTVCRLIDAGLRNSGYKVYTKTTGTLPMVIDVNNDEKIINRLGPANIREQLKIMHDAKKQDAEILVIECMAVNPELQEIVQQKMVNADIVVITNVREDHIGEMGDTLDELAFAFSKTLPKKGKFIINNDEYLKIYQKENINQAEIIIANEYGFSLDDAQNLYQTFPENLNLSLSVCETLKLSKEEFLCGMKNYHKDFGAYQILKKDNVTLISAFAANDVTSTRIIFSEILKKYSKERISVLFNCRDDRPTRTNQFIDLIVELNCPKVMIYGSNISYIKRKLFKKGIKNIHIIKKIEDLKNEDVIFGIGNIKNFGIDLINFYKGTGEYND